MRHSGDRATFVVRVLFEQHSDWQSTIEWCEESRKESFRSSMELMLLMDSALKEAKKVHSEDEESE